MQGDWKRRGIGFALAVACAIVMTWPAFAGTAGERATCELDGTILRIDSATFDLQVAREGDEIVPRIFDGPIRCSGGPATVLSVDRIRFEDPEVTIDLSGGEFAPGATDEGDGSSEIEIGVPPGSSPFLVRLGGGPQHVRAGDLPGRHHGVNLNAGEESPDADIIFRRRSPRDLLSLELMGQDGPDRISGNSGPEFNGSFPDQFVVGGGNGDDWLRGTRGEDFLDGGRGHDELWAGGGADLVLLRDELRDFARCGAGADVAAADRRDRIRSCRRFYGS
jgi:RTX calcium-binding nonapeptide repeat (4 copies)